MTFGQYQQRVEAALLQRGGEEQGRIDHLRNGHPETAGEARLIAVNEAE